MSDTADNTPSPLSPQAAAEGGSPAADSTAPAAPTPTAPTPEPKPSLLDNPALIAAATGITPAAAAKKIRGRPFPPGNPGSKSTATPERLEQLLKSIRNSFTMQGAANALGVPMRTVYYWQQSNPEISQLIKMARATRLEGLLKKLIELSTVSKADRASGHDWRAIAFVIERLPWAHTDLYKRDPNAITPDVLAAKISEVVASIIPMLPPEKHAEAQSILEKICGTLRPRDEGDEDGGGDGR